MTEFFIPPPDVPATRFYGWREPWDYLDVAVGDCVKLRTDEDDSRLVWATVLSVLPGHEYGGLIHGSLQSARFEAKHVMDRVSGHGARA